jgi:FtsH-binding integral membrane protein
MYAEREFAAQPTGRMGALDALSAGIPAELTVFVKKTYALLAFSLVLGGVACVAMLRFMPTQVVNLRDGGTAVIPDVSRLLLFGLWGGTLVFSLVGNFAKRGARAGEVSALGLAALCGMVLCSGAMLAPTIGIYVGLGMANVVAAAAVVTAVTFTALTLVVFATGKDFGFMGKFLLVAGIAFFVAWLVGAFFVRSAGFQWWLAAIGAILFCGFILFDTSTVVRFYGPNNLVVPAVIALYLDIFNLFVMLLYLLGGSRRND